MALLHPVHDKRGKAGLKSLMKIIETWGEVVTDVASLHCSDVVGGMCYSKRESK